MNPQAVLLTGMSAASRSLTQVLIDSGLRRMDLISFALSRLLVGALLVFELRVLTSDPASLRWGLTLIAAGGSQRPPVRSTAPIWGCKRRPFGFACSTRLGLDGCLSSSQVGRDGRAAGSFVDWAPPCPRQSPGISLGGPHRFVRSPVSSRSPSPRSGEGVTVFSLSPSIVRFHERPRRRAFLGAPRVVTTIAVVSRLG